MVDSTTDPLKIHKELLVIELDKVTDINTGLLKKEIREFVNCPLCGSEKYKNFWKKDSFVYVRCQKCKFVYVNPRLTTKATLEFYNSGWVDYYNKQKFFSENELDKTINRRNLVEIARIKTKGNLLEIGCGSGYFLQAARDDFGFNVFGVELDAKTSQYCRETRKLNVITGTLEQAKYPENFFDVVYLRTVLEHISEPRQLLEQINKIMKPGGMIVIEVPNVNGLIYRMVGARHVCVFGFEHFNFFSTNSLVYALNISGYKKKQIKMESLDFTMASLINCYFGLPAFTTVNSTPVKVPSKIKTAIYLTYGKLKWIDRFLPGIANALRSSSVIIVYALKK